MLSELSAKWISSMILCSAIVHLSTLKRRKRKLFIYWEQGWEEAPMLCKCCLRSWEKYNRDTWEIVKLDRANTSQYIDMVRLVPNYWEITPIASRSDILRINLLNTYENCLWVDATLFCTMPLDRWIYKYPTFFAFSDPTPTRKISSWFMFNRKRNYIVETYCKTYNAYWRTRNQPENYFQFHIIFNELYASDPEFKRAWDEVPNKLPASLPHSLKFREAIETIPESKKQHIMNRKSPCYKLDHNSNKETGILQDPTNAFGFLIRAHDALL
jgi:hypothetical protein